MTTVLKVLTNLKWKVDCPKGDIWVPNIHTAYIYYIYICVCVSLCIYIYICIVYIYIYLFIYYLVMHFFICVPESN